MKSTSGTGTFLRGFARILLAGAVSNGFEWLYVASSCRRSGAVTNALLAIYVLVTGNWQLW